MLKDSGVASYALAPVYFNNSLTGVLEIYSKKKNVLHESLLARLDPVMPLLSQMLSQRLDKSHLHAGFRRHLKDGHGSPEEMSCGGSTVR